MVFNNFDISLIENDINNRIQYLSNKSKHYVVDMGDDIHPKEEKVYHKAGKGKHWCGACERIKELKKIQKLLKEVNK